MGDLEKLAQAERMLAEVRSAPDAVALIDMAEAARVWARQMDLGTGAINHATAIKLKAERRLASAVDEGQQRGEIQKHGGVGANQYGAKVGGSNISSPKTLTDLGIDRWQVSEARLVAEALPSDAAVDALVEAATGSHREVSRSDIVRDARVARRRANTQNSSEMHRESPAAPGPLLVQTWQAELPKGLTAGEARDAVRRLLAAGRRVTAPAVARQAAAARRIEL